MLLAINIKKMGRNNIEIRKLEVKSQRLYAYYQRKRGLLKKAMEMSVLCDLDLFLVFYDRATDKLVKL